MSDLVKRQVEMLRRGCMWQQAKGTKLDNGYPYHKHYPDCEICRSAETIEQLQARVESLWWEGMDDIDRNFYMIDHPDFIAPPEE